MNKQRRGDYGNAPDTVPTVKKIPNEPIKSVQCTYPAFKATPHPFKKSDGAKTKL